MSLRDLPKAKSLHLPNNLSWEVPSDVFSQWAAKPLAAEDGDDRTIYIYDIIGEDWWTGEGVTAKKVTQQLRAIGEGPVTVRVNSPGGDLFEGLAIYNTLRAHKGEVTIQVMGWAASAASIIAMAGDKIVMGLGSFMMVHNAWGIVIGNRHDMREAADVFDGFDGAIVDVYEARTGRKRADIEKLMDAETFMGASQAVKEKFADSVDDSIDAPPADKSNESVRALMARRQTEAALAKAGFTRTQRSDMLAEMGTPGAAARDAGGPHAARDAGLNLSSVSELINAMSN